MDFYSAIIMDEDELEACLFPKESAIIISEGSTMSIKEMITASGMTLAEFSRYLNIPYRSIQNWTGGVRECPPYLLDLIEYKLRGEGKIKAED